ncbi:adenosylcobinamide hydrolase [Halodesulfurarchaeum formicicum]|uniref:Adenosylcobinamide hydrolase n=1 Tax=Halodesulfurarchaeum formicicum TaxID=1873524 RepID=A0A1D8S6E0_9EURY|nr:adenosylcobinamide amidohydrolase [Halodesulfurarchaeum formicicum]AOW80932.1 adenosylcobinamide hydrolase [Halodesulfurarchaeum formicicum]
MFETTIRDGVLQANYPGARWLLTGWSGGYTNSDAVYNVSVPEGWERTDLDTYVEERRQAAGFETTGPGLLTGVELQHAAGAARDGVRAVATVGLSNPASLPLHPDGSEPAGLAEAAGEPGTINLLVGTDRALEDGALATLLAAVVEAKTATVQAHTGFTGTTSDAVAVATDPTGDPSAFAGSATAVGDAARSAVRRAITDSLASRMAESPPPETVEAAEAGIVTSQDADPFDP